jgi:hypothetical protein
MKPAAVLAALFLAMVSLAHLLRLILRAEIVVDGTVVPLWLSVIAVLGPGALAIWLWREQSH